MLSINLLGSPSVTRDGAPVRGFVSSKAAALVYYLAATARPHAREALAGLLWPEVADAQASKNLRDVLSNLRRLLDAQIEITRQTVELRAGVDLVVDSRSFEQDMADAGRAPAVPQSVASLHKAVARYRGDFMEGFSLADAPAFEEWALVERERLRQLVLNALARLASHAAHQGDYAEGIAHVARLLALDPTREEAQRQLMLLLALSGQRGAALAQYAACRRVLDEQLGVEPDEATELLHRRILDGEVVGQPLAPPAPSRPQYQLPAPRAAFVGRAAEVAQVVALLGGSECRLVTITGPGGMGKTSLALHAARQLAAASQRGELFAGGMVFVTLASAELPGGDAADVATIFALLADRVADALHFTIAGPEPPHIQLAGYLHDKNLLLLLDNCEHLPIAGFVIELLERAPQIAILATTRGRLNVRGEQIVELDGLAFPSGRELAGAAALEQYSAIELFRRTAQAASPRLAWARADAVAAARICQLVAGLPLAIELAASLARLLPLDELAREIAANLEFLHSARPDLPERHRSLRAVFDHSWRLLGPAERRALRQLAVFRGGFSRAAAAHVAGAALPLLAALLDNSLVCVVAEPARGERRYELLELVRQYAAEQLAAADEQAAAAERHARYFLALLTQNAASLRGARQQAASEQIYREIQNIRAAWRWAVEQCRLELIGPAAESLFFFYEMRSWFREGADSFADAAAQLALRSDAAPQPLAQTVRAKLLARQGWCAFQLGRQAEARALLLQSLTSLRRLELAAELVLPLNYLASLAYYSGDYAEAEQLVAEALELSRACGDQHGAAVALTVFGQIATLVGRYDDARRYSEESLAIERELGNRWGMVFPLISLGRVAQATGAYREAQHFFQEGLATRQSFGDTRGVALCLQYLGDTAEALADYPEASWFYREALELFQKIGNQSGLATVLVKLGYNALSLGEPVGAGSYFQQALRAAWQSGAPPRMLDALAGIAMTLSGAEPQRAGALARLVIQHPAATKESRDRAGATLVRLGQPAIESASDDAHAWPEAQLRSAVLALLAE